MNSTTFPVSETSLDWLSTPRAVVLDASSGRDGFSEVVTQPVRSVVSHLRALHEARQAGGATTETVILKVTVPAVDGADVDRLAYHEALLEALRGIAGSMTLELAYTGLRVNVLIADEHADLDQTVDFLASDAGGFVAGATLDLREGVQK